MTKINAFTCQVTDAAIADLHHRLDNARWPDQVNDENWSYGTDLDYLKELVNYWRHDFDWREQEERLNSFDHFTVELDGLASHFIHQRSPHEKATPLLINHGWPGSVIEFLELIPRLTEPEKFGGRPEDAFHVVAPSLPGYGFSEAAKTPGMNIRAIAQRHVKLMSLLGYERYICQGGDWGSMITRQVGDIDPEHCVGIHLNMVFVDPPDAENFMVDVTETEKARMAEDRAFIGEGMGYFKLQATKPQTLAYALQDSPVGLCAWIAEKFHAWSDCGGEIRNAISWDTMLTNISLYWFTNTIGSSVRLYYEHLHKLDKVPYVSVPTGVALYPKELYRPPKAWVKARYNLVHWFESEKGGHFAAMEQPQRFAENLWEYKKFIATTGAI